MTDTSRRRLVPPQRLAHIHGAVGRFQRPAGFGVGIENGDARGGARGNGATIEHEGEAVDRLSFVFRGRSVTAGASTGVAILGLHAEAGRALEEADSAMYVRKAQRRHEA